MGKKKRKKKRTTIKLLIELLIVLGTFFTGLANLIAVLK